MTKVYERNTVSPLPHWSVRMNDAKITWKKNEFCITELAWWDFSWNWGPHLKALNDNHLASKNEMTSSRRNLIVRRTFGKKVNSVKTRDSQRFAKHFQSLFSVKSQETPLSILATFRDHHRASFMKTKSKIYSQSFFITCNVTHENWTVTSYVAVRVLVRVYMHNVKSHVWRHHKEIFEVEAQHRQKLGYVIERH